MIDEQVDSSNAPYLCTGTFDAPLGDLDVNSKIRPVTMVFCAAEAGRQFCMLHRRQARLVHKEILACIRNTLRFMPTGYLCRAQEGELKYMVVFSNPQVCQISCFS